jgi:hypothetical protein
MLQEKNDCPSSLSPCGTYTLDVREDLFADAISRTKWRKPESANG